MTELFSRYSISEIILFITCLALATKAFIEFVDWARKRARQAVKEAEAPAELQQQVNKQGTELNNIKKQLNDIKQQINLLILSDRDDIKQSITKDHHYFCYKLKSIDDYSLDCIEKRYSHYKDEGGNSFVATLMQELRALPHKLEKDKW